jgi:hypothetical protein
MAVDHHIFEIGYFMREDDTWIDRWIRHVRSSTVASVSCGFSSRGVGMGTPAVLSLSLGLPGRLDARPVRGSRYSARPSTRNTEPSVPSLSIDTLLALVYLPSSLTRSVVRTTQSDSVLVLPLIFLSWTRRT